MKHYVYMRKDKEMVSLNPEYGIEVTALGQIADSVKNDNPELYNVLTILIASLIGNDEKKLLEYCNRYLEEKAYSKNLKDQISQMLEDFQNKPKSDSEDYDNWNF